MIAYMTWQRLATMTENIAVSLRRSRTTIPGRFLPFHAMDQAKKNHRKLLLLLSGLL